MKIADPEIIKAGEQELIQSIMGKLDSEMIENIASDNLTIDNMTFRNGDMVIHENRIVYKMDFEINIGVSVMFDRDGNIIDKYEEEPEATSEKIPEAAPLSGQDDIDSLLASLDSGTSHVTNEETEAEVKDTGEDDMTLALQRTRDFWLSKSRQGSGSETPDPGENSGMDDLEMVLQRNRDFWSSRGADVK